MPIIKLCRVQTNEENSWENHNENSPEELREKSAKAAEVVRVNVTIDLVDSESDMETGEHQEPVQSQDLSVYNVVDSESDSNSYTELCQANPPPSTSSDDNNSDDCSNPAELSLRLNSSSEEEEEEVMVEAAISPSLPSDEEEVRVEAVVAPSPLLDQEDEVRVESIVTQSQPHPPPPPSDAAMSWLRSNIQPAGVSPRGVGVGERESQSVAAPLFVIGKPRSSQATRANSDSDEDVRILPSSSRARKDSQENVIEID